MKPRTLILFSILFLAILQTSRLWPKVGGGFDLLLTLAMAIAYLVLLVAAAVAIYRSIRERFSNKQRNISVAASSAALILAYLFPFGIIDPKQFEAPDLFVAQCEGVANCTTTIKLKPEHRFVVVSICFGVTENAGHYTISGDTLNLSFDNDQKTIAILNRNENAEGPISGLSYFLNQKDKQNRPLPMRVLKNELFGNP